MKNTTYGAATSRSGGTALGLYRPEADVTFGSMIAGQEIVLRKMKIAAECGTPSSFKIEFSYEGIETASADDFDTAGCTMVNDTCVMPSYDVPFTFELLEFTDDTGKKNVF